jgi:hypothetical protein
MGLAKIKAALQHAKGGGVLIAIVIPDSHRGTTTTTNTRGRILEEFLISKQLYIMNEESVNTTFRNRRGVSNVYLTIISNQLF